MNSTHTRTKKCSRLLQWLWAYAWLRQRSIIAYVLRTYTLLIVGERAKWRMSGPTAFAGDHLTIVMANFFN